MLLLPAPIPHLLALLLLLAGEPWVRAASCPQQQQQPHRRLTGREKREMQREILALLGIPGRPRPRGRPPTSPGTPRQHQPPSAAPLFMLDLYRAMARQDDSQGGGQAWHPGWAPSHNPSRLPGPLQRRAASGADTVMSFVNMGELLGGDPVIRGGEELLLGTLCNPPGTAPISEHRL